ncbi:general secretion pathway protein GspB [Glaciecola siphonariae]|uniref:General secretion pathway protein GspB n=1 Tax=Glaciecola siphonariae TaxID=521012 RepID=A0ABV9M2L4_9ALTE
MLKQVATEALKPGMMITQVIEQRGPVKIRRVGMVRSEAMIKGLKEMGVMLVEVDEAQSLEIEGFETDNSGPDNSLPDKTTQSAAPAKPDAVVEHRQASAGQSATQRLMAQDKKSATVDRQLSQQFHRSLFMPAIDDMPSKWRLFVRPYGLLVTISFVGFCLGFALMNIPQWLSSVEPSNIVNMRQSAQHKLEDFTEEGVAQQLPQTNSPEVQASQSDDQSSSQQASQNQQVAGEQAAIAQQSEPFEEAVNASDDAPTSSAEPDLAPKSYQSINGVVLNEGETVLGYGADDTLNIASNTASMTTNDEPQSPSSDSTEEVLSPELLRRVNQVAAQLEAQQQSQGDIIPPPASYDANDLIALERAPAPAQFDLRTQRKDTPRIDQLPAGILVDMPSMSFSAHMYASDPQDRWVRVNGLRLSEGDFIEDGLAIVEIQPEKILLAFKGETFSMNALSDW